MEPSRFKYREVETQIRRLIKPLPLGGRLPSERMMAKTYGCNFLTVRRALKELVADGTVIRSIGRGTFVARHRAEPVVPGFSSRRVGVLVWQRGDETYSYRIIHALHKAAMAQNVEMRTRWLTDFSDEGLSSARLLAEEGCVALVLPWLPYDRMEAVRAFVGSCPLPVSLPLISPGIEKSSVAQQTLFSTGMVEVTTYVCDYFHALGCRHIALLGPDMETDILLQQKLAAYVCYMTRKGLSSLCGMVRPGAEAMDALARQWQAYRGNLAVIGYDDEHALRFMTAMHKLGLKAPQDFRIIGCNNTDAGRFSDPPLSTLCPNYDYIGRCLLKGALALAKAGIDEPLQLTSPRLLVRDSCGGADRLSAHNEGLSGRIQDLPKSRRFMLLRHAGGISQCAV
jgi:DNA-binding transcriptional regulator YhcF (GntR family)